MAPLKQQRGDKPFVARQRVVPLKHCAHAVRKLITPLLAATPRNPIAERASQQRGRKRQRRRAAFRLQPLHQLPAAGLPVALVSGKRAAQIRLRPARRLFENSGKPRRCCLGVRALRADQHRREPRIVAELRHLASTGGKLAVFQRAKRGQQLARGGKVDRGRQIQPAEFGNIATAPHQQLQQQTAEIALGDFRLALRACALGLLFGDEMQADARLKTPGATGPLGHRRLADTLGDKPRQAGAGVKARHALLGAVHHQPDAFDGQAGFGDVGGQHHFAHARRRGQDRFALLRERQRAVQRTEHHIAPDALRKLRLHPLDLADARQKQQQRPRLLAQQPAHRLRHGLIKTLMRRQRLIATFYREAAPFGDDRRRLRQQRLEAVIVECRGHDKEPEILTQPLLDVEQQRQREIRLQAALVELIENDQRYAGQLRVTL
ncbi:putative periplasmic protein kinase ArgK and related GTPases of G3E family [Cronobacter muytjensii 530]